MFIHIITREKYDEERELQQQQHQHHQNKHHRHHQQQQQLQLEENIENSSTNTVGINTTNISKLKEGISKTLQIEIESHLFRNINKNNFIYTYKGTNIYFNYYKDGTYGAVFEVQYGNYVFMIKIPYYINNKLQKLDEREILNNYPRIKECPNIIPIDYFGQHCVIMLRADGDLQDLIDNEEKIRYDINLHYQFIKTIYNALMCLEKKGLYYYDIKLENILYNYKPNGDIEIFLGDIGSIQDINDMITDIVITTYI